MVLEPTQPPPVCTGALPRGTVGRAGVLMTLHLAPSLGQSRADPRLGIQDNFSGEL